MRHQQNTQQKTWLGFLLVAIGAYFLLRNFNLIPSFIPHYLFGWEMILILVGGFQLVSGKREGFILMSIGGLFLLNDIFYLPEFRIRDWWPLILIAVGISIFMKKRKKIIPEDGIKNEDYLDSTNVFGGSQSTIQSENFKGGNITSVFGGSEISLANVNLTDGEVMVNVFCMFGGSSIIIPADWTIVNNSFVMFGGIEDNRPQSIQESSDPKKILRINGSVIFGGLEIKGA
ncbi:MAG: cell wall-active antibiotics response protein [Reichenbachiella sp.]